jgi:PAS domain S-box-containing protein
MNKSFLAILKIDRQLDAELRAKLVASLFASPASLALGATAGSVAGVTVAATASDLPSICAGLSVPVFGSLRVAHGAFERRRSRTAASAGRSERLYELGAWLFSASLGLLAFFVLTRTADPSLHLLVGCVAIGYAAGICARNAGRPVVALGQLTLAALPVTPALALSHDPARWVLGAINLLFILGLADITRKTYFALQSAMSTARAREDQYKEALDHLPHMAWSADSQGAFTHYSRRWTEFTGSSLLDSGGSRAALVHPDDWPNFLTMWNHSVETGSRFEAQYRLRHRSGKYRWVLSLGIPERDDKGRVVRWHGTCTDVHDKQLAQHAQPAAVASVRAAWP